MEIEWQHDDTFGDWTLLVPMPQDSHIRGVVSYTCPKPKDYTVWGTIESNVAGTCLLAVERYENPSVAVDAVGRDIIGLMSEIITRLSARDTSGDN